MTDRTITLRPTLEIDHHVSPTDAALTAIGPAVAEALRELHALTVSASDPTEDRQYLDLRARSFAAQAELRSLEADYYRTGNRKTKNLVTLLREQARQMASALRTADDTRARRERIRSARRSDLQRYITFELGVIRQVGDLELHRANVRAGIAKAERETTLANIDVRMALRKEAGDLPAPPPVPDTVRRAKLMADAGYPSAASNAYDVLRRRARENGSNQADADAFAASSLEELYRLGVVSPPDASLDRERMDAMNIAAAARRTGR